MISLFFYAKIEREEVLVLALKYNYQDFLEVDDDTYSGWLGKLENIEKTSMNKFKQLAGSNYDSSKNYQQEFDYCKENIFMSIYADDLSSNLFSFHLGNIQEIEEEIKYYPLDEVVQ